MKGIGAQDFDFSAAGMAPSRTMEESDASMRKRLVESLSASFPGSALSKALHAMDADNESDKSDDPLSSSCFAELRLEQGPIEEDDDELTSLSWLQDSNLIKTIGGDERLCTSPTEDDDVSKENDDKNDGSYANSHPPNVPYNPQKHVNSKPPYSFSCLIFMAIEDSPIKKLPVKDIYNWILTHFPYFQNAPTGWKNSVRHNLSLNKCFKKVEKEKGQTIGKGSLWCIDPYYRPNLLQALRKTPYHPYHQLQMLATPTPNAGYTILSGTSRPLNTLSNRLNLNTPSPHLFPFLSKRLAQSKIDSESDIDVANTLVSLKRAAEHGRARPHKNGLYGQRSRSPSPPEFGSERERELLKAKYRNMYRRESPVVIYSYPSEDHTYSMSRLPNFPGSPGSDVDEEYDWGSDDDVDSFSDTSEGSEYSECDSDGEGRVSPGKRKRRSFGKSNSLASQPFKRRYIQAVDEDEEMKIVEGADALLNLAGIKTAGMTALRNVSPSSSASSNNNNNDKDSKNTNMNGELTMLKLS